MKKILFLAIAMVTFSGYSQYKIQTKMKYCFEYKVV